MLMNASASRKAAEKKGKIDLASATVKLALLLHLGEERAKGKFYLLTMMSFIFTHCSVYFLIKKGQK